MRTAARATAAHGGELLLDSGEAFAFDRIFVATGRAPRTSDLGLETAGVQVDARGAVIVDRRLKTSAAGI